MSLDMLAEAEDASHRSRERRHLDDQIADLLPSQRLIYDILLDRVRAAAENRGDRHVLLGIRGFDAMWLETAYEAAKLILMSTLGSTHVDCTAVARNTSSVQRALPLTVDAIARHLEDGPVLVMMLPDDETPTLIEAIADDIVEIAEPPPAAFAAAIGLEDLGRLSPHHRLSAFRPVRFDMAMSRGRNAEERLAILDAILADDADDEPDEKTPAQRPAPSADALPRVEDLHGYGAAGDFARRLVEDLAAYRRGDLEWRDIDSGALFVGPPGTGKTMLAAAIAGSSGAHFVPTSYAEWQSSRGGYLGDVTKAIRRTFEDAAANLPAIVFIDEIDAIRARGTSDRNDSWFVAINGCLLECMDGVARREGIVVLAACNHDRMLDPALVRAGRLDRRFFIGLPDEEALAGIFRHHLGAGVADDAIGQVATLFAGTMSGADVVRIARDARRRARLAGRQISADDLIAVAVPPETRSPAVLSRVAIHEAGHAVVRMIFGTIPTALSIIETGDVGGAVRSSRDASTFEGLRGELEEEVACALAGRAAEDVLLGSVSAGAGGNGDSDLARATGLLAASESILGLGRTIAHGMEVDGVVVHERLARIYAETVMLVARHRGAVEDLAGRAIRHRVLGRATLVAFAEEYGFSGR
ncbi:ATP-dependent Zn protease [Fulvimarina pelagi HTCC2506]|uniref:ATP-dependent Zn protease n=1 Tax=Fulvimarina pelagi HTCC2506 TaxID=314231 RepID=Q0G270_9HYPH|nr:AAA family ATPase [Fulvimarina pelagi]EAU41328.1 ATP-dependent Zn protease [Fulvimarina pelagi HTCC2506]